jgi:hypothetical protein
LNSKFKASSRKTAKKEIREYLSLKKKQNVDRCADILCGFTGKTLIQVYPSEILREKIYLKRFAKVIVSFRTDSGKSAGCGWKITAAVNSKHKKCPDFQ